VDFTPKTVKVCSSKTLVSTYHTFTLRYNPENRHRYLHRRLRHHKLKAVCLVFLSHKSAAESLIFHLNSSSLEFCCRALLADLTSISGSGTAHLWLPKGTASVTDSMAFLRCYRLEVFIRRKSPNKGFMYLSSQ
jgi:hypothetical protein